MTGVSIRRGDRIVLEGVDLDLEEGDRLIVAGENGTGKTTLLKAVLGLVPIESGQARVLGNVVGGRAWRRRRGLVGYVDQNGVHVELPITAHEVAEIGACRHTRNPRRRHRVVEHAMHRTGCAHLAHRLFRELSGGERQKVSLARCLCQEARVLVLDEPTTSLDPSARQELLGLLERMNEELGITIVVATHDNDLLSRARWPILRLDDGTVVLLA